MAEHGAISFARFMELALYCPLCGYYEKKADTPGQRGDYFTSVSVGSLFGELLAFQFAEWLKELPVANADLSRASGRLQIVEAGAHDGRLAKDVLSWMRLHRTEVFGRIEYCIVEPSLRRQEWQGKTLQEFDPKVRWFSDLNAIAPRTLSGVFFSNELLDAMPVQRLGWDAKRRTWFEWGVTVEQDRFVWTRLPGEIHPSTLNSQPSPEILEVLPDGFTTELSHLAANWWREAASTLQRGKLLTLDYGLHAEDFFLPQRANGTLRAYHQHRFADDVLANPGEQDITAHVNFSMLKENGERAGLKTEADCSQAEFLTRIFRQAWQAGGGFKSWTSQQTRQFQTLTHPEHLGCSFRVLLQSAGGVEAGSAGSGYG